MANRITGLGADAETRAASMTKYFSAVLSGALLTAAFPPFNLDWIAWFALIPLFRALENEPYSRAFKLGFAAGFAHYLTLVYWIVVVLGRYGNLNLAASVSVFVLLCLYLSLYLGAFSLLTRKIGDARLAVVLWPSLWVALEYLRAHLVTGFPWCLLGYTQYDRLSLIQVADVTGVYGLSFLIAAVNVLLYRLLFKRKERGLWTFRWEASFAVLAIAATLTYGHQRLAAETAERGGEKTIKAAAVQANIDQSLKWDAAYRDSTMSIYEKLTRSTFNFKPDLVVWPETAVPFFFQDNAVYSPQLFSLVRESGADLIFGSPAYKRKDGQVRYYNRAYLLSPEGDKPQFYDKVHLVPFGEYVPLKGLLSFVNRLVPAAGDFEGGTRIAPLKANGFSSGVLICFEAIFPDLARQQTKEGAQILVNLTNDAWFGRTSAPYQHLSMAVFRAVENKRPLIRAANTGFSAFIDADGRIKDRSPLFKESVLKDEIKIHDPGLTFYTRYGDLFAYLTILIAGAGLIARLRKKRGN